MKQLPPAAQAALEKILADFPENDEDWTPEHFEHLNDLMQAAAKHTGMPIKIDLTKK